MLIRQQVNGLGQSANYIAKSTLNLTKIDDICFLFRELCYKPRNTVTLRGCDSNVHYVWAITAFFSVHVSTGQPTHTSKRVTHH